MIPLKRVAAKEGRVGKDEGMDAESDSSEVPLADPSTRELQASGTVQWSVHYLAIVPRRAIC